MCFILLQHITTEDPEAAEKIMEVTREQLRLKSLFNKDALYLKDAHGEVRTSDPEEMKFTIASAQGNLIISHLRIGTSGENSALNAHGWEHMGWKMIHNGFCHRSGATRVGLCDSALMFYDLVGKIVNLKNNQKIADKLIDVADEYGFSGRAILWNEEKDIAYTFGDFKMYYNAEVFALSSVSLSLPEKKGKVAYRNLVIPATNGDTYGNKSVRNTKLNGVWQIINFSDPKTFDFMSMGDLKPYVYRPPVQQTWQEKNNKWNKMSKKQRKELKRQKANTFPEFSRSAYPVCLNQDGTPIIQNTLPIGRSRSEEDVELDASEEMVRHNLIKSLYLDYDPDSNLVALRSLDDGVIEHITPAIVPKHIINVLRSKFHIEEDSLHGLRFEYFKSIGIYVPVN